MAWVRVQDKLYNVDKFIYIELPLKSLDHNNIPYWAIHYSYFDGNGVQYESWNFNNQPEAELVFKEIERALTSPLSSSIL